MVAAGHPGTSLQTGVVPAGWCTTLWETGRISCNVAPPAGFCSAGVIGSCQFIIVPLLQSLCMGLWRTAAFNRTAKCDPTTSVRLSLNLCEPQTFFGLATMSATHVSWQNKQETTSDAKIHILCFYETSNLVLFWMERLSSSIHLSTKISMLSCYFWSIFSCNITQPYPTGQEHHFVFSA